MRLTTYTDYTLRVLIFLTLKYRNGEKATIPEIAEAYGISRNHLMKIVNELSQRGFIETLRGRGGGTVLARPPASISVGEIVRMAEEDFALVECHVDGMESHCAVWQACNLKRGFRRALDAFMTELDKMTLEDAVTSTSVASSLLGVAAGRPAIPIVAAPAPARAAPKAAARRAASAPPRPARARPV
ncbi:MAG: Rrf2 family transcriptional regulator, partial [Piscinibacter sp.]|nr:Rrf2 family transcriptional regulator [Piscinibacter sp.]